MTCTRAATALLLLGMGPAAAGAWRPEKQPLVLNWVVPAYPDIAIQARVSGAVAVRLRLGQDGRPTDAICDRRIPLLSETATQAALEWNFEPSDEPERQAAVEFVFQLMPRDAPASDLRSRFLSPSVFAVRAALPDVQVVTASVEQRK